jgi:trimeric autotransporter adhesin
MKKITLQLAVAFTLITGSVYAQNVNVTGAVAGNGTYPTLGSAFAAINAGSQTGANIVVSIAASTTETATAVLNGGAWNSLSVIPSGGGARTISGNIAGPLVNFDGADRVVVNGLNTGGNSLIIDNSNNTSASTVQYLNDARIISLQNLTLRGANSTITSGTVLIFTGNALGNDSLLFDAVTFEESAGLFPVNHIYSQGTAVSGQENSQITVNNCRISNFFSASTASAGILAVAGNTDWTVTGNRFYQTASRTYTTANTHKALALGSGSNHTVSSNVIGYAAPTNTGVYTMLGTIATRFIAIELNAGSTPASSVQANTVTAISLNTSSGATTTNGILCGINLLGTTSANVGTAVANVFGSPTGTGSIIATSTTSGGLVVGINSQTSGTVVIQNNTFGAITCSGITATIAGSVAGINVSAIATSINISNNIIGNTTADNIRGGTLGLTTGNSLVTGIAMPSTSATATLNNNIIRNLASYGTGTGSFVRGITTAAATGNGSTYTITNNSISNLVTNSANTSIANGNTGAQGIQFGVTTNSVISGNIISNISNINTGTNGSFVAGIAIGNATNLTVSSNRIFNLSNAGTSTTTTAPSIIAGIVIRSGTTQVNIVNNMISLGNGQTTNSAIIGIMANHGSTPDPVDRIYFNTINIEGTVAAGAQPSFGIARTDFSLTARVAAVDIRNNLITNTRSGGTGVHCAIANNYGATTATATGWGANASNNNVLNANAGTIGWWNTAQTFAGWQGASVSDASSFSGITVNYINPVGGDLHLNMGTTPTLIESNGQTIASFATDIDNQVRPGPTGSVNGGAFLPDIGADEFDGVPLDILAPVITFTPLGFICDSSARTVTATISDLTGVPTTGTFRPRIYFRKNANGYVSNPGTLTSGNAQNGTWSFTINAFQMGGLTQGDVVSYFIIAQDVVTPTFNIGSNPATGLVATNVNTVTTPPATPASYPISFTLSGTYTVGTTGIYPTLTAAVNAYNNSCIGGPVVFSLIDAAYTSETYPITINANAFSSTVNTLTIKPATGVTSTFSGSSTTAMIIMNGADNITIDGTNGTTINSLCPRIQASRNLIIENTNTSTASAVVSFNTTAGGDAATNNRLMNSVVLGSGSLATGVAVNISGPTIGSGVGANANNNNQIVNNEVLRAQVGIFNAGSSATTRSSSNSYHLNELDSTGTFIIGRVGIMSLFEDGPSIQGNSIANFNNSTSTDQIAIAVGNNSAANSVTAGAETINAIISGNQINGVVQTNTFSAVGILVAATNSGTTTITNNMVNGVFANGTAGDFACGIYYGGGTGQMNIFNNSVVVSGAALTGASQPNMALGINGSTPPVDIRNNILVCAGSNGFNGNTGIGLAYTSTTGNYANLVSSNNDIFVSGTSAVIGRTNGLATGTTHTALSNWQTETGRDLNSASVAPAFVSSTNLHLIAGSNPLLEDQGVVIASVTSDIDCNTRDLCSPDIGADEFGTPREINVQGNSVNIANGSTTTSLADSTSFGTQSVCAGVLTRTFTIQNTGNSALSISGVTITGTNAVDFTISTAPAASVAAASSTTFSITFDPSFNGLHTAVVNIASNDCNEAAYTFAIDGTGTEITASANTQVDETCFGDSTGSVSVTVTGGVAPISYLWNTGDTTAALSGLGAGFYLVTVTDANGCTSFQGFTLNSPPQLFVNITSSANVTCNSLSNGSATAVSSGGSGTSTYAWSSGGNAATETGLAAGVYAVTVTDSLGCTAIDSVTITQPDTLMLTVASQTTPSCFGDINGTATVTSTGGTAPYSYNWSTGGTAATETGLGAGSYGVIVTDSLGCSDTLNVIVTQPNPLTITASSVNPTLCAGINGSIDLTVTDGTPGYTYQWNNSANTQDLTFIPSGSYTCVVTDTNGCVDSVTAILSDPAAPLVTMGTLQATICADDASLTLTGTPAGGTFSGPGVTGNTFDPSTLNGTVTLTYTYTDTNTLCQNSASQNIFVDPCSGVAETGSITNANVYPNPNTGMFTLSLGYTPGDAVTVEIFNSLGQVVNAFTITSDNRNTDISMYESGIYNVRISDGSSVKVLRVIVQK